ncbi:TPA: integrase arm-type DNA-binding domain-containing protein [Stenotrophomonas maltophilia]|uniref:Integrase arm-type DNA-binding domain-containing protein n=1 Tax=Stenotrophomonas maltophilia TaxID=40324 RepID=A0AAI9C9K9_STEMA|nr:integrase arm-type DNA-binding domain-containing protein [Stenotrophomonas maltophilia]EKT4440592.1 integrase arm-type DNA-binding domain-containing protein [Stenotrophomonas maltophilia]MBN5011012.1 integrase arm-type DNA-binding domain-containing protein [Stenotrophomonas maltophilia]HDS1307063.1 integrase arm-type DNA-binding domain-containing protein [Stenotrophomonas maltophilia]HDS1824530.1 integrase arm-type DNA-binding domain-containing protein [Stenotrophomonas maltophilia]HDX09231
MSYLIDIEHLFSPMPYYEIQSNRTSLYGKQYGTYLMARPLNRLTARAVQTLTIAGYHADGGGLYLLIKHSGTKSWVLRYRRQGRLREMGLGAVRLFGLQEARAVALEQQKLLALGKDPIEERRCTRVVGATFGEAVDAYIQSHRKGWKNQAQADQWHQSLRDYGPAREMAVSAVTTNTVMACLSPIWTTKTVPATRVRGLPEWLAVVQSALLNESATLFRRRYYTNGSHAGFILYMTDPQPEGMDVDALREALRDSRGPGNFRNLFMHSPNGKKDGLQLIPISEVAAKDEFTGIKRVTRDDILAALRIPPQLLGIVPQNAGGFGSIRDAATVWASMELAPLQSRLAMVNEWIGEQVITFAPFEIERSVN